MLEQRSTTGLLVVTWAWAGAWACTGDNPEYMRPTCDVGTRTCVDSASRSSYPVVCRENDQGAHTYVDEWCPPGAMCTNGLCLAPTGAQTCTSQKQCATGEVCVPLIVVKDAASKAVTQVCLPAATSREATKMPGQQCTSNAECKSFLCLPFLGGNSFCFMACVESKDCQSPQECTPANKAPIITITGLEGSVQTCVSPR